MAVKHGPPPELAAADQANPAEQRRIGSHLRDLVIDADGSTVMISAANWDQNLFGVNLSDGTVRWRTKAGHHFAYDPQTTSRGFVVQGFDLHSPEGYHLYLVGEDGELERRFALYGLPKKATAWANAKQHTDRINNFAASPEGSWVASAGDLGLAVWSREGKLLWSDDWWANQRKRVFLLAPSAKMLVTMSGSLATAHDPVSGDVLWRHQFGETGTMDGAVASQDGRVIVLRSSAEGGRLFVLRDGRHVNTLNTTSRP